MNDDGSSLPLSDPPVPTPQFYIPATASLLERRPRTLKHGDSFALFDHYGDVLGGEGSPEGLYHDDTRYLSHLELLIDDRRPLLLSSTLQDDNAILTVDLTNPDIYRDGRIILPRDTVHIVRSKFLWQRSCDERLAVRNFDTEPHGVVLTLRFGADFADLFEVRGHTRPRRGTPAESLVSADRVTLAYTGLDGITRRMRLSFEPPPTALTAEQAVYRLTLEPRERRSLLIRAQADPETETEPGVMTFGRRLRAARRALRQATRRAAAVSSSNAVFNEVARRSVADLYTLMTDTPQGPYPYAGIPWFSTAFGRDGIITAMQMLWMDPEIARGALRFLAATQAKEENPAIDAEPGKILHETRRGEMALLGEVPFRLYYGSVDATPLFVMLAGMYLERTGDIDTIGAIWPNIEAALEWIDTHGDRDGDGFCEYHRQSGNGLANQGWKDSHDSVFHADGRMAEGPIALCEVQGYVFAAKRHAAAMARALGKAALAASLEHEAQDLARRFEAVFWCEDLGTYALALDGDKRPCRVSSSNAGHALFAGIASPERAERVARTLLSRETFSGWGIRTVATSAARYNPMAYHNGSIWPHDNALIALGLARYGLKEPVLRVMEGLFAAASYMDFRRLPELFCGFGRRPRRAPTLYPVACSPQAWASATPLALLQACLGLACHHRSGDVCFDRPALPDFLEEVTLRGLSLGEARVDLLLRRHAGDVAVHVLDRAGPIRVIVAS